MWIIVELSEIAIWMDSYSNLMIWPGQINS